MNSIQNRFVLLLVTVVSLVLGAFGAYNYRDSEAQKLRQLDTELEAALGRLKRNLPDALWRFDKNLLHTIVDSELGATDVLGIEVFNDQAQSMYLAATLQGGKAWTPEELPADVVRKVPLHFEENDYQHPLGTVHIYATTRHIHANVQRELVRLVGVMLALNLLVTLTLLAVLRVVVLQPLFAVRDALKHIASADADLSLRLPTSKTNTTNTFNASMTITRHTSSRRTLSRMVLVMT